MADIRRNLIAHIREQIQAGTYVTQKKLQIVVDRIVEKLGVTGAPPSSESTRESGAQAESGP